MLTEIINCDKPSQTINVYRTLFGHCVDSKVTKQQFESDKPAHLPVVSWKTCVLQSQKTHHKSETNSQKSQKTLNCCRQVGTTNCATYSKYLQHYADLKVTESYLSKTSRRTTPRTAQDHLLANTRVGKRPPTATEAISGPQKQFAIADICLAIIKY
jgi:hypothetical protein